MDRSEPTLVPEWLRNAGNVTGGGNSTHQITLSTSLSDVPSLAHRSGNRNSRSVSDFDSPRSPFLDHSSSSNSRRSSSNGSAKHAYSSFTRNHRDKDRDRDKDRLSFGDWERDSSDPLRGILGSRNEKDTLRLTQSMVSRKQGELFPRRVFETKESDHNGNHKNGNGLLSGGAVGGGIQKTVFDKDFPALVTDEKQAVTDITRASSPGLSLAVGNSSLIGGECWTSALAEVPNAVGSSGNSSFSVPQNVNISGAVAAQSSMAGLNMAEALAQVPLRTHTAPQLSVKTQRLEELAIKQSRQLIPVTPSTAKGLVLSPDKLKVKPSVRTSEMNVSSKGGQPQTSLLHNTTQPQGGHPRSDMPKTSHGKLLVLKPAWENGVSSSPMQKDVAISTNSVNMKSATNSVNMKSATNLVVNTPAVASAPLRSSSSPKLSPGDRKAAGLNVIPGFPVERKPSLAQTQSRTDFFNRLKKKTLMNASTTLSGSSSHISSSTTEQSELTKELAGGPLTPHALENGASTNTNGGTSQDAQRFSNDGERTLSFSVTGYPDEEEAAFLRSLGWEENDGEDEGLTEDEINAFYQEVMKLRPSLKLCRGMQPKLPESFATNSTGASSEMSSSDYGSDA